MTARFLSITRTCLRRSLLLGVLGVMALAGCATKHPATEAIEKDDVLSLRAQLDAGLSPDFFDDKVSHFQGTLGTGMSVANGASLMVNAMLWERWDMVDLLVQRGADLRTAAREAARDLSFSAGGYNLIQYLLARGFNPDQPYPDGWRLLYETCPHPSATALLIKGGAKVKTPAVVNGAIRRTPLLACLDAIAIDEKDISYWRNSKLPYCDRACIDGQVKALVERRRLHVQTITVLLDAGADPNLLYEAATGNAYPLLNRAVDVAPPEVVSAFLKHNANPNRQDSRGWSALHVAAENGYVEVIRMLVAAGANPSLKSKSGQTAQMVLDAKIAADKAASAQRLANEEAARGRRENAAQSNGFQWGKLAAMGAGAAIGGIDKLPADTQARLVAGMVADSQAGHSGAGNFQSAASSVGAQGATGASRTGGDQVAANRAIAQRCQASSKSFKPWNDPQVDSFCQMAAFDKCLADNGIMAYEGERRQVCSTLRDTLKSTGGSMSACGPCS